MEDYFLRISGEQYQESIIDGLKIRGDYTVRPEE